MKLLLLIVIVGFQVLSECSGERVCTTSQLMTAIRHACSLSKRSLPNRPTFYGIYDYGFSGSTDGSTSSEEAPAYPDPRSTTYVPGYPGYEGSDNVRPPQYDDRPVTTRRLQIENDDDDDLDGLNKRYYFRPPFYSYFWPSSGPRRGKRQRFDMNTEKMRRKCCIHGCSLNEFRGACHFNE